MDVRLAMPHEQADLKDLWNYCFDDSRDFVEWFFKFRYKASNTLVLYDNDRICSALQLLPYNITLRGRKMSTSYLVGVSTWPEDRGKGYVSKLILKSLKVMREREQWVSILLPFNYNFYRRYGWETCYLYNQYQGQTAALSEYLANNRFVGNIMPILLDRDLEDLTICYSDYTRALNGYVLRNEEDWNRILTDLRIDGGEGYIYRRGNEVLGYIFLVSSKGELAIRSICSRDMMGYMDMLKFALAYSGGNKQFNWFHRLGDSPVPWITEFGIEKLEKPYVMGRIVYVTKAFEGISLGGGDANLVIQVLDPLLEWNNQRFNFVIKGNELSLLPTRKLPDFTIPISTLSQLLWGFYNPRQAIGYGLLDINNFSKIELLDLIFPETQPYIYEDY